MQDASFDSVLSEWLPGNEVALRLISRVVSSGRISNAYLFKGPKGSPKDAVAKRFASILLCDSPSEEGRSCGACKSCRLVTSGNHPDLYLVEKEGASIKIKKSHEILREALLRPYQSPRKVFLILDADTLTIEASNALLKILEEPPAYVTFLLTTSNPGAIPDTILSRCQVVPVKALSPSALRQLLVDRGVDPREASQVADVSGGNLERAMRMLREEGKASRGADLLQEILASSPVEAAQKYSKLDLSRRVDFVDDLEIELVRRLRSPEGPSESYLQALKVVLKAKERLSRNVNAFLTFTVLFLDISRALKGRTVT
ncbi:MAG: DNA polymerase III subunit delta' [Bacillota bacterium]|jgi:DNA polymerase-3 subunit delta'|nr:DNA polymerase III subunit delta' [Candidatus Fermentithermobacillaceae bacterium]